MSWSTRKLFDKKAIEEVMGFLSVGSTSMHDLGGELASMYEHFILKRRDMICSFMGKSVSDSQKAALVHSPLVEDALFDPMIVSKVANSNKEMAHIDFLKRPAHSSVFSAPKRPKTHFASSSSPRVAAPSQPAKKPFFRRGRSGKGRLGRGSRGSFKN